MSAEHDDNTVMEWVKTWPNGQSLTNDERTLIIGNLNGFYAWLKQKKSNEGKESHSGVGEGGG